MDESENLKWFNKRKNGMTQNITCFAKIKCASKSTYLFSWCDDLATEFTCGSS